LTGADVVNAPSNQTAAELEAATSKAEG
jgi:hypothetical protein